MRSIHQLFAISVLAFSGQSFGATHEIQRMEEILPSLRPGTLVVFDIDNTLIRPVQSLGSDQWGGKRQELYKKTLPETEAVDQGVSEFAQVQRRSRVIPVEASTPELVRKLQAAGYPVMALTARPLELAERTIVSLASVGVDLRVTAPDFDGKVLDVTQPVKYLKGVLAVGPHNNKGEVLAQFLRHTTLKPTHVVFADDKRHHVDNVEKALALSTVEYDGFRYGAADAWVKSLDMRVADFQWYLFQNTRDEAPILSDAEAGELLQDTAKAVRMMFEAKLNQITEPAGPEVQIFGCEAASGGVYVCKGSYTLWNPDTARFDRVRAKINYKAVVGVDAIASIEELDLR